MPRPAIRPAAPAGAVPFHPSPDYKPSGATARKIELLVLHCTEGSYASALAWLTRKDEEKVSAHYIVAKTGAIVQLVAENDVSYHAGLSYWRGRAGVNEFSLGVELENKNDGKDPYPAPQLAAALWLLARACRRHGLTQEQVVGHADVAPGRKTDPAAFPWQEFRYALWFDLQAAPGGTPS